MTELLERRPTVTEPVTVTYLRYRVVLLDERHLTIYSPDGSRIVAGAHMTLSSARRVIRGYRAATLDERSTPA